MSELEKKHRANLERLSQENLFRLRELQRDWEQRCRILSERTKQLQSENDTLEQELRHLAESQAQQKIQTEQELRELGQRIEDEELMRLNSRLQVL